METVVTTFYVDGNKFVLSRRFQSASIVQFFEERDEKSLPAKY